MQISMTERFVSNLSSAYQKYKYPIITSFVLGFLTYMFVLSNKIINWDDAQFLFGKGYTLTSGRWGLDLISFFLPDYSMPWLWGVISIFLITVATCVTLEIFRIENKLLQCLLAGLIIAFPSEIGTMFYMFTSSSYAVAFLLAVLSVYYFCCESFKKKLIGLIALIFSLSIYQAYVAVSASFFVVIIIKEIMTDNLSFLDHVRRGLSFIAFLFCALILYLSITYCLLFVLGDSLNGWAERATSDGNGILYRCYRALKLFYAIIFKQTYGITTTKLSVGAHIVSVCATALLVLYCIRNIKDWKNRCLISILTVVVLPLSCNCLVIMLGENGVHGLTVYGFVSVYLFSACALEQCKWNSEKAKCVLFDIIMLAMLAVIISNVYTANKVYLKQYIVNKQTQSFYDTVISQIQMTPGFDEDSEIMIIGAVDSMEDSLSAFGEDMIYGLNPFRAEAISDEILYYYCGFCVPIADETEKSKMRDDIRFLEMPVYPYYGYVQEIDGYIVVKLSD